MTATVHHGDARSVLADMPDNSVDAVVTDPPYALVSIADRFGGENAAPAMSGATGVYARASAGFMGQGWDTGETAFDPGFWAQVLRVLKPGGWLAACGGTRTYHRLACAVEDGGFDIRDMVAWLYGTGFPKSLDFARDGDLSRALGRRVVAEAFAGGPFEDGYGSALKPALEPVCLARKPFAGTLAENVAQWGVGGLNIDGCRVASPDGRLYWPANTVHSGTDGVVAAISLGARFFYAAKPSPRDRVIQCLRCLRRSLGHPDCRCGDVAGYPAPRSHPTVKPINLVAWLCRLITPPGGIVLDPFAGSGTLAPAAAQEGFDCILVEREPQFIGDILHRVSELERAA